MKEVIVKLLKLQELDNKIVGLDQLISAESDSLVKIRKEYDSFFSRREIIKGEYENISIELSELKKYFEEKQQSFDKSHQKLPTVKNEKEYKSVLKEVDNFEKDVFESELRIMELEDEVNSKKKELEILEEKKNSVEQNYEASLKKKNDENLKYKDELKLLHNKRNKKVEGLKKRILSKYETLRRARDNIAIVRVDKEVCTGCYMKIPPQLYVEVKKEKELIQCPSCQRFLYYRNDEE